MNRVVNSFKIVTEMPTTRSACFLVFVFAIMPTLCWTLSCLPCDEVIDKCVPPVCRGGTVLGECHCCKVCAKQVNETCGGLWWGSGRCDRGLECIRPQKGRRRFGQRVGVCKYKGKSKV